MYMCVCVRVFVCVLCIVYTAYIYMSELSLGQSI